MNKVMGIRGIWGKIVPCRGNSSVKGLGWVCAWLLKGKQREANVVGVTGAGGKWEEVCLFSMQCTRLCFWMRGEVTWTQAKFYMQ